MYISGISNLVNGVTICAGLDILLGIICPVHCIKELFFKVVNGIDSEYQGLVFEDGVNVQPIAWHQINVLNRLGHRCYVLRKDIVHITY